MPQQPAEPPAEPPKQHDVASIMEIMKEIQVIYSDSSSDAKDIAETYRIRKELLDCPRPDLTDRKFQVAYMTIYGLLEVVSVGAEMW